MFPGLLFGVLSFDLNIVENHIFSDIHICMAWDVHNIAIFLVTSLRLGSIIQCVAEKVQVIANVILQWIGEYKYSALV